MQLKLTLFAAVCAVAVNGFSDNDMATSCTVRRVTFTAKATGVKPADAIEFFLIGPLSDRAYESFAVSDESPAAIVKRLEAAGLPLGVAVNPLAARLWPQGEQVRMTVNGRPLGSSWRIPVRRMRGKSFRGR